MGKDFLPIAIRRIVDCDLINGLNNKIRLRHVNLIENHLRSTIDLYVTAVSGSIHVIMIEIGHDLFGTVQRNVTRDSIDEGVIESQRTRNE